MLTQENTVLIEKFVKHFLLYETPTNILIWFLANTYRKMGVLECTLLRIRFVKTCMHVSCLTRAVLLMLHVREVRL